MKRSNRPLFDPRPSVSPCSSTSFRCSLVKQASLAPAIPPRNWDLRTLWVRRRTAFRPSSAASARARAQRRRQNCLETRLADLFRASLSSWGCLKAQSTAFDRFWQVQGAGGAAACALSLPHGPPKACVRRGFSPHSLLLAPNSHGFDYLSHFLFF